MASERGDWVIAPCPQCEELKSHIDQLEECLAAARASQILVRAELDALLVSSLLSRVVGVA